MFIVQNCVVGDDDNDKADNVRTAIDANLYGTGG